MQQVLFFTLNREDFSFVIHLDRQLRTSRRREAQTGSRARSGSRSERTLDAVEHSRTLMEWWPFLIFHRGGLRIKVINNTSKASPGTTSSLANPPRTHSSNGSTGRIARRSSTPICSRPRTKRSNSPMRGSSPTTSTGPTTRWAAYRRSPRVQLCVVHLTGKLTVTPPCSHRRRIRRPSTP